MQDFCQGGMVQCSGAFVLVLYDEIKKYTKLCLRCSPREQAYCIINRILNILDRFPGFVCFINDNYSSVEKWEAVIVI